MIKIAYIGLTIIMVIVLVWGAMKAIYKTYEDPKLRSNKLLIVLLTIIIWHIYIFAMTSTGLMTKLDFPPLFFMFLILPAFIFSAVFARLHRKSKWLQNIPTKNLIFYQSFRVAIESLFVLSISSRIIHQNMTIEGYNYDMIFGVSAMLIGFLYLSKKISNKTVLIWNIFGLIMIASIIVVVILTLYIPQIFGPNTLVMSKSIVLYPYILVPGFLMPSAVFVHALSIAKLTSQNPEE